ncbi:MAG: muconolactone delta-isomerase [Comamonadaceae bacterium]|nr:MAG: muconolactone delta-isomerase [Comamonadaceae bacterium]
MADFLVTIDFSRVIDLPPELRASLVEKERSKGLALIEAGTIKSIWDLVGEKSNVGIWSTAGADELQSVLQSLPIFPYAHFEVRALVTHPLVTDDYSFFDKG